MNESAKKRSIAFILPSSGISGGGGVVLEYASRLADLDWDSAVYGSSHPPTWFDRPLQWIKYNSKADLIAQLKRRGGVVFGTWWETVPWAMYAAPECLPIHFVQDFEWMFYRKEDTRKIQEARSVYGRIQAIASNNPWVAEQHKKLVGDCLFAGNIGIDHSLFRPDSSVQRIPNSIGIHAREVGFWWIKNPELSKNVIFRVHSVVPGTTWKNFGPQQTFNIPGVPGRHSPFAPKRDLVKILQSVSVYLHTANHEGFGLPIIEAMACGTPVVTTPCGGNMEFCRDEENCIVRETEGELCDAVVRVFSDEELKKKLSNAGIETARKYMWGDQVKNLSDLTLKLQQEI